MHPRPMPRFLPELSRLGSARDGRQPKTGVIAMSHNERANRSRRKSPARLPHIFRCPLWILKRDIERLGEILSQVVRSAALKRLPFWH